MASENRKVGLMLMAILVFSNFVTMAIGGLRMNDGDDKHYFASVDFEDDEEAEEDWKRQVENMNKPPAKTIWTDYGDIIDCVDIYKQPAFHHPLLKNHKIQRRPSNAFLRGADRRMKAYSSMARNSNLAFERCPPNTVPIRRITKESLKRYKSLMQRSALALHPFSANSANDHFAIVYFQSRLGRRLHRGSADIDGCNPKADLDGQVSTGQIFVEAGPPDTGNSIQSGWMVNKALYGDNRSRFFTYWTGNSTRNGCFDVLCPGFVQVSRDVSLGEPLSNISIYCGPLFDTTVTISQDSVTKNWWVYFTKKQIAVGYWPSNLFPFLSEGATMISFGGRTAKAVGQTNPQMGNGLFPDGDYYHSCFFVNIQVTAADSQSGLVNLQSLLPDPFLQKTRFVDSPNCYNLQEPDYDPKIGYSLLFGGPGGDC